MKKLSFLGIFLVLLVAIVQADLTFDPTTLDFESVNQDASKNATVVITNPDPDEATDVSLSAGDFTYSNEFIGSYSFDGGVTFDPSGTFSLSQNDSQSVISTINVPLTTRMGQYDATFTATYDGTTTQNFPATVFVIQYVGRVGDLEIIDTNSFDDIPDQMRKDRKIEFDIDVENTGSQDLTDVKVDTWLYDADLKEIVAYDSTNEQTIDDGREETFNVELDLDENLDEDHSFDLYVKAYKSGDEASHREIKTKDIDVLGDEDLCDIGDLRIEEFDLDDDEYAPGDTIQIEVEIENKNDDDDVDDVIVEVWLTERGKDKELEDEKSSKTDINSDETETFSFELELDNDLDDGNYEVHVRAYESGNDEDQCIEDVQDIDIERPDHKVILDKILISPTVVSCGELFTAELDVQNVGDKDDDAVKVRMYNSELEIDEYSDTFDLEQFDDKDDDRTVFITGTIPEGATNREYTLTFTLYYDDLGEQKNYVGKIMVTGCLESEETETTTEESSGEETTVSEEGTVFLPTGFATGGFFGDDNIQIVFWILGIIALIVIIIYFLTLLFRKNK